MDTSQTRAVWRPRGTAFVALALTGATALTGLPGAAAAGDRPLQTVIVTGASGIGAAVRSAGGTVLDALPLISGVVAQLPRGAVLPDSFLVVPDRRVGVSGASTSEGPLSTVRGTLGLGPAAGEGTGVTVAVVDTGVADVADLAGRVRHVDVTGEGTGDGYGHGTFVAGLIAGDGAGSGGSTAGVAPGARILDVRVADDKGNSSLAWVLKGLQAVAANGTVDVLNLSLSSGSPLPYQIDPLTVALEALWRRGVTVVVPAGNDGANGSGSVTSPGIDPVLMTVGGLDEHATSGRADDSIAPWSSQGPAPQGVAKPDLVAPGAHLISTGALGSVIWKANPSARLAGGYFRGSGTSFSSAVTAGAAAALLADRKRLSPDQVKALLTSTTYNVAGPATATGAGGLDLAAAVAAKTPRVKRADTSPPGSATAWQRFVQAVLDGDVDQASSSWSRLSPEARQWAARQWADVAWADGNVNAEAWAARQWAARQWAARQWAARQWADSDWTARQWADSDWTARQWAARQWADSDWTARQWAARQWSTLDWS